VSGLLTERQACLFGLWTGFQHRQHLLLLCNHACCQQTHQAAAGSLNHQLLFAFDQTSVRMLRMVCYELLLMLLLLLQLKRQPLQQQLEKLLLCL